MIVRLWHGRVPTSTASAYCKFSNASAVLDYQSVDDNLSVHFLERTAGEIAHLITLTSRRDFDSIRSFAGEDVEVAKYYPEDRDVLLEFEPSVLHYEGAGRS